MIGQENFQTPAVAPVAEEETAPRVHVFALSGPAQAGKTTVAAEIQTSFGFSRYRFADGLKSMLSVLGVSRECIDGPLKEAPLERLCGQTPRHAMQTLGTEWRNMIGRDLWAIHTASEIETAAQGRRVLHAVIDDLRFPHELDALRARGFSVTVIRVWNSKRRYAWAKMRLARSRTGRALARVFPFLRIHQSEAWWPVIPADHVIDNSGSLPELYQQVSEIICGHGARQKACRVRLAGKFVH